MKQFIFLICVVCVGSVGCTAPVPVTAEHSDKLSGPKVAELCARLHLQEGGTVGYPHWDNTIRYHEPAASILKASCGVEDKEVIAALSKKLTDYTPCKNCCHEGKYSSGKYTVSDVACYLLAEIHCLESLEPVFEEVKRRRAAGRSVVPIAWAIRYYHTGHTYNERLREKYAPKQALKTGR